MNGFVKSIAIGMVFMLLGLCGYSQLTRLGEPVTGAAGITLTVEEMIKQAALLPAPQGIKIREEMKITGRRPTHHPLSQAWNSFPKSEKSPVLEVKNTQAIHSNFLALNNSETAGVDVMPPDCMGDVGPTQVCVASNNRLKWYAKPTVCNTPLSNSNSDGTTPLANPQVSLYLDNFFQSVRASQDVTDPHVHYDRLTQRWFIVAINTSPTSNRIMLAVSSGPTITAASSFTFYYFEHDQGAATGSTDKGHFCDYPTLGVDKNALYIAGLIFNGSTGNYIGTSAYVVRKSSVTSGGPIVFTPFRNVGTSSTGIFCAQGVHNDDPGATNGYYVGVSAAFYGVLNYVTVLNPGGTPTIVTGSFNVPATDQPLNIDAVGSTQPLDAADDRLLNARLSKNTNTGVSTIWASHNIGVNSSGVSTGTIVNTAMRWYQLNISGNAISLNQSGTLYDGSASGKSYWMGDIAASGQGHAVIGATVAGPGAFDYPNAAIAGRYSSTPAGTLYAPVQATSYFFPYNKQTDETQRWGDYSQTVVDPNDNMTIWTFQEVAIQNSGWGVRAVQLKAPPPATITSMTAITCSDTRETDVNVTGSAGSNFAGFYDPGSDAGGPGFANRLTVSSTGGVVISNVQYVSPTQVTFRLNYLAATLGSQQTLTITNPDCQSVAYSYTLPDGCTALPVTWLTLNATWAGSQARIEWKVGSEINVRHYEIERSADGTTFVSIGKVNAAGVSTLYQFLDAQPNDVNYYRVVQVDSNGQRSYSSVLILVREGISFMSISPNPAIDQVKIILPSASGNLRLIDARGAVVTSLKVGASVVDLKTASYARGMYLVEFTPASGKTLTEKLILR